MHYIRFLKVPRLIRTGKGQRTVTAKITITTDLGESFLATDVDVDASLEDSAGNTLPTSSKTSRYAWEGGNGMRSIEVYIDLPKTHRGLLRMLVQPVDEKYVVEKFQEALTISDGGIAAVRSMEMKVDSDETAAALAERRFTTSSGEISIYEETGDSIARHIWDAGLVLSAYISQSTHQLKNPSAISKRLPRLPCLEKILTKPNLNILELGAGCGIVGITLAHSLPNISKIILTDLPEATEILSRNLSPSNITLPNSSKTTISHQVLDWFSPLPTDISFTKWDLVVVADCTYNPDIVPNLVQTLSRIQERSKEDLILLAMKVRHESEMVFFDLMSEHGFDIQEKCKIPLPMLDDEGGQEIEIFVFGIRCQE